MQQCASEKLLLRRQWHGRLHNRLGQVFIGALERSEFVVLDDGLSNKLKKKIFFFLATENTIKANHGNGLGEFEGQQQGGLVKLVHRKGCQFVIKEQQTQWLQVQDAVAQDREHSMDG